MLLNVPDKLGVDDLAVAQQSAVWAKKARVADGGDHAVKE